MVDSSGPHNGTDAALHILRDVARRGAVARRFVPDTEQRLLQSIVEATVRLFDAEASSIALFERDPDRLEFAVAAGPQGQGVIGHSVPPTKGIVGYVYSTGEPMALSDVASDPRFDRKAAEQTGYVPRSIAAVPLVDGESTVGVLQVLDKRDAPAFTLRDMELMAVFANQAAAAIAASRVQRELPALVRAALAGAADGELDDDALEALVDEACRDLDRDEEVPFWALVATVSRLRTMGGRELSLVNDILDVVAAHRPATRHR